MDSDLVRRVDYLEETVESLRDLPDRTTRVEIRMGAVVSQTVHLRAEMATKEDLRNGLNGLRRELQEDIARLGRDFAARLLESEGRTRVLIEDLVVRITTGREGRPSAN